jgi:integrase/recombinase XerD
MSVTTINGLGTKNRYYAELPDHFKKLLTDDYKHLTARQLAFRTIVDYWGETVKFLHFLQTIKINDITKVSTEVINTYLISIYNELNIYGRKNRPKSLSRHLYALRNFFDLLEDNEILSGNPARKIKPPIQEKSLPRSVLSKQEVALILKQPDISTINGLKARAILEVLYGCGLRNFEFRALTINDIDLTNRILTVRLGKGQKDRRLPIGDSATYWLERYLKIRNILSPASPYLFLAVGEKRPVSNTGLINLVRQYKKMAGISKDVCPHTFRHCFATHLLEAGHDIRSVQDLLGHKDVSTTMIYTHVMQKPGIGVKSPLDG